MGISPIIITWASFIKKCMTRGTRRFHCGFNGLLYSGWVCVMLMTFILLSFVLEYHYRMLFVYNLFMATQLPLKMNLHFVGPLKMNLHFLDTIAIRNMWTGRM